MRIGFLHGFLGEPAIWDATLAAWPRTGDELVRVALPGHGGGDVLPTWDENVAAVGEALGKCDVVVGYSLGGRIAISLVVAGIAPRGVLVSANPGLDDAARPARRAQDAEWIRVLRDRGIIGFLDVWEAQPLFATRMRAPLSVREGRRARRLRRPSQPLFATRMRAPLSVREGRRARRLRLPPEQLARSLEVMGVAEMPDRRAVIDDRFTFIVGADDTKFLGIAQGLSKRVTVIPEGGHDLTIEQPVALAAAIAAAI